VRCPAEASNDDLEKGVGAVCILFDLDGEQTLRKSERQG
jgi:hypothetical protein